jgi:hypothetical protein
MLALLIVAGPTATSLVHAEVTSDTYHITLVEGQTQEFRLETNPTTGLMWWVQSVPSDVVVKEVRMEPGTEACLKEQPPPPGCGQEFQVFSISSNVAGEYVVEFRLGRAGTGQYYRVAYLNVSVTHPATILDFIVQQVWAFLDWVRCLFRKCG